VETENIGKFREAPVETSDKKISRPDRDPPFPI